MRKMLVLSILLLAAAVLPLSAYADVTVDVSFGQVQIGDTHVEFFDSYGVPQRMIHKGEVLVKQSDPAAGGLIDISAKRELSVTVDGAQDVTVTLRDVVIAAPGERAALDITGDSDVQVELDGSNALTGGDNHAGLEVDSGSFVTIRDADEDGGALVASGGIHGAGIGGAFECDSGGILVESGEVVAVAGKGSAGIGGGRYGSGQNIAIAGGKVTATGDKHGAGIGGGENGDGSDILISGGEVEAVSGDAGAGIGGGDGGHGAYISIIGGEVKAVSAHSGAGIGGGAKGNGSKIHIEGGSVNAVAGDLGAGIGGGWKGYGVSIAISGDAAVTAEGKANGANIGDGAGESDIQKPDKVDVTRLSFFGTYNDMPGDYSRMNVVPLSPTP